MHRLADVVIDGAAVPDGDDQGVEIVLFQDHIGHFPGDIGAGAAHGDAHVRGLEGRAVVDAVAGHGDHPPACCEAWTISSLLLGLTREKTWTRFARAWRVWGSISARWEASRISRGHILAQAQFLADGIGGGALVAGDHDGVDAGPLEGGDGFAHPFPDGVHHAHHAQPGEAIVSLQGRRLLPFGIGHSQDPLGLFPGHRLVFSLDALPVFFGKGQAPATLGCQVHRPRTSVGAALQGQEAPFPGGAGAACP